MILQSERRARPEGMLGVGSRRCGCTGENPSAKPWWSSWASVAWRRVLGCGATQRRRRRRVRSPESPRREHPAKNRHTATPSVDRAVGRPPARLPLHTLSHPLWVDRVCHATPRTGAGGLRSAAFGAPSQAPAWLGSGGRSTVTLLFRDSHPTRGVWPSASGRGSGNDRRSSVAPRSFSPRRDPATPTRPSSLAGPPSAPARCRRPRAQGTAPASHAASRDARAPSRRASVSPSPP